MKTTILRLIGLTLSCIAWTIYLLAPVYHRDTLRCAPWRFAQVNGL